MGAIGVCDPANDTDNHADIAIQGPDSSGIGGKWCP